MNRQRNRAKVVLISILFFFSVFYFNSESASAEKGEVVSFELNYKSSKEIVILFLVGKTANLTEIGRENIINATEDKTLWNYIWENYTINNVDSSSIQRAIIGYLNNSFNIFLEKILGVQYQPLIIKRVEKIQYAKAIGIEINAMNSQSTLTVFPLKFIFDEKYKIDTNIKISIGYDIGMFAKFDQKKFTMSHYRALILETIEYERMTNEITIYENQTLSPSFLFVFVIICTIVCIAMTYDASRRNEKMSVSVLPWIFAFVFYFFAFIPFSNILVYITAIAGIVIAVDRFRKGILFGKKIKRERYHHAMAKEAKISAKLIATGEIQPQKVSTHDLQQKTISEIEDSNFIYEKLNEYGDSHFTISPSKIEIYRELGRYAEDIYISGLLEDEFIDEGEEISIYDSIKKEGEKGKNQK